MAMSKSELHERTQQRVCQHMVMYTGDIQRQHSHQPLYSRSRYTSTLPPQRSNTRSDKHGNKKNTSWTGSFFGQLLLGLLGSFCIPVFWGSSSGVQPDRRQHPCTT
eukprot:351651-Chlamydomonas_euryale.AAC.5